MQAGPERGALTPQQMRAFRYMWAHCLLSSERFDEAIALFRDLSLQGDRRAYEGLLDAYGGKMNACRLRGYRRHLLRKAKPVFLWFLADILRQPASEHPFDRFIWKLARFLKKEAPGDLPPVFEMLDAAGYWNINAADRPGLAYRRRTAEMRARYPS